MSRFLQVFYVFFSAAMLALAIPNELIKLGSPLAGFISLIPLYIAYSNLKSYKEAAAIFALHTFIVHVMTSFWLAFLRISQLLHSELPLSVRGLSADLSDF